MLVDRRNLSPHIPWIVFSLAVLVFSTVWYVYVALNANEKPSGSTLMGFTLGVVAALIMLFEFLLWPRKKLRSWRLGRAQTWMRAHIWLGLLVVPLVFFHSGFRFGGWLSSVLMVLMLVVVLSGIWGLIMQQYLPSRLLHEVPAETIYSQIEHISTLMAKEARRLVSATCGRLDTDPEMLEMESDGKDHITVGAVRTVGSVQGKVLQAVAPSKPVPNTEPLRAFFEKTVRPFLERGDPESPLWAPNRAATMFESLRTRLPTEAHATVEALESFCDQRRQFEQQARWHFWLHSWLCIHLPLSAALIVFMFLHIFVAVKYW
ncbi:MAG: hypothetical protein KatS3mg105_2696 [Gemmatales bacterium]|nr:MAG: hypothetical protein KatS3mg105_2696 [Gemmatales bacterium]